MWSGNDGGAWPDGDGDNNDGRGIGSLRHGRGGKIGRRAPSWVGSISIGWTKGSVGCEGCSEDLQGAAVDNFV